MYEKLHLETGIHFGLHVVEVGRENWQKHFAVGLHVFGRLRDEFHHSNYLSCRFYLCGHVSSGNPRV